LETYCATAEACLAIAAIHLVDDAHSVPDENPFDYNPQMAAPTRARSNRRGREILT